MSHHILIAQHTHEALHDSPQSPLSVLWCALLICDDAREQVQIRQGAAVRSLELGDGLFDLVLRGARELVHLLAALVELEGGHRLDAALLRDLRVLVDVHFDEDYVRHLLGELREDRRDMLAGPAPRRSEVNHHLSSQ